MNLCPFRALTPVTKRKGSLMTDLHKTRHQPIEQLFDILDDTHAVMLGLDKTGHSMQPMAPQVDEDRRGIWFFTKRDSELGSASANSAHTVFRALLAWGTARLR